MYNTFISGWEKSLILIVQCELQLQFTTNSTSVPISTLYQSKTSNRFKVSYSLPSNATICRFAMLKDILLLMRLTDNWKVTTTWLYSSFCLLWCSDTLDLAEKGDYWLIVHNVSSCVIVLKNDPAITALREYRCKVRSGIRFTQTQWVLHYLLMLCVQPSSMLPSYLLYWLCFGSLAATCTGTNYSDRNEMFCWMLR